MFQCMFHFLNLLMTGRWIHVEHQCVAVTVTIVAVVFTQHHHPNRRVWQNGRQHVYADLMKPTNFCIVAFCKTRENTFRPMYALTGFRWGGGGSAEVYCGTHSRGPALRRCRGPKVREAGGTGGARVHERGAHSGHLWTPFTCIQQSIHGRTFLSETVDRLTDCCLATAENTPSWYLLGAI